MFSSLSQRKIDGFFTNSLVFVMILYQRQIQDFPVGAIPKKGRQPIIWLNFPENCMKIKKIGARRKGCASKILQCRSATVYSILNCKL